MTNPDFMANARRGKGRYRSCNWIEGGVFLTNIEAKTCCMQNIGSEPTTLFSLSDSHGLGHRIVQRRAEIRLANQSDEAPCAGCYELQEREWEAIDHLQFVAVSGFLHCNLACSYCTSYANNPADRGGKVLDYVKEWYAEGLLKPGSSIDMGGGESTLHIEFDEIAEFAFAHGMKMRVFTNGTGVSPPLLEGLSKGLVTIVCSIDAGTPETYLQIKGKPMFHRVWSTLGRYVRQAPDPEQVIAKYIVMERNRSKDEIDAFFTEAGNAGVTRFIASINNFQNKQANGNLATLSKRAVAYILKRGRLAGSAIAADLFSPAMEAEIENLAGGDLDELASGLAKGNQETAIELSYSDSDTFSNRAKSILSARDKFIVLFASPFETHTMPRRVSTLLSEARAAGGRVRPVRSDSHEWTGVEVNF